MQAIYLNGSYINRLDSEILVSGDLFCIHSAVGRSFLSLKNTDCNKFYKNFYKNSSKDEFKKALFPILNEDYVCLFTRIEKIHPFFFLFDKTFFSCCFLYIDLFIEKDVQKQIKNLLVLLTIKNPELKFPFSYTKMIENADKRIVGDTLLPKFLEYI